MFSVVYVVTLHRTYVNKVLLRADEEEAGLLASAAEPVVVETFITIRTRLDGGWWFCGQVASAAVQRRFILDRKYFTIKTSAETPAGNFESCLSLLVFDMEETKARLKTKLWASG